VETKPDVLVSETIITIIVSSRVDRSLQQQRWRRQHQKTNSGNSSSIAADNGFRKKSLMANADKKSENENTEDHK